MTYLFDSAIIILLFALFGVSHTILASCNIKKRIIENAGNKIAFYRLFYNISSLIIFLAIYEIAPKPKLVIYDLPNPFDLISVGFQVVFIGLLIWTVRYIDGKEFLGISQIIRYYKGTYDINELDEKQSLVIKGPFKFVRHPIYLFSFMFLLVRPTMDLFYLISLVCILIYFVVGSYYEEKKLIERFGDEYIEYQKKVSRIFPIKF
ncbi:MAG: isoprenylcysteine carboxylmethyltransferase family protein [Melioribacteraceae bacterium]|nr:isoprenylcysteine carboxylmethyltransferase family protein [Melioribacteraceae bacterium]